MLKEKLMLLLVVLSIPLLAQGVESDEFETEKSEKQGQEEISLLPDLSFSVESFGRSSFDKGKFGYRDFAFSAESLFLSLSFNRKFFDWAEYTQFSGGEDKPFKTLTDINLGSGYYQQFSEKFSAALMLTGGYSFEDKMDKNSFSYLALLMGNYSFKHDIALTFGAGYSKDPLSSSIFPMAAVDWRDEETSGFSTSIGFPELTLRYRVDEKLNFETVLSLLSSPIISEASIGYLATKKLKISTNLQQNGGSYRLAKDNPVSKHGFVELSNFSQDIQVGYQITENVQLISKVAYNFKRELKLTDSDENEIAKYKVDEVVSYLAGVEIGF